eukprot:m.168112 g.168112  ORF g.168112 m.168112 type:complete len:376 (-) comp31492_c1_seq2:149-1276(-)
MEDIAFSGSLDEMQTECRRLGLDHTGDAPVLRKRLSRQLSLDQENIAPHKNRRESKIHVKNDQFFGEGGAVDRFDKCISMPLFGLETNSVVELAWSIPATWYGIPMISQTVFPFVLASMVESTSSNSILQNLQTPLAGVSVGLVGVNLFRHVRLSLISQALDESDYDKEGIIHLYMPIPMNPKALVASVLLAPHIALLGLSQFASPQGFSAACYFLANWVGSLSIVMVLKLLGGRSRPAYSLDHETIGKRHFEQHQWFLRHPMTRFGSFPSGDAACAGAFFFASNQMMGGSQAWFYAAGVGFLGSLTGRMFFHAHHALDVIVGGVVAFAVSRATMAYIPPSVVGWKHVLALQSSFFVISALKKVVKKAGGEAPRF